MNSVIYEHTSRDFCEEFNIALDDGRTLHIGVTPEGVIMDVYSPRREGHALNVHHDHLGTAGMMFDEWADWIVREDIAL